MAYTKATKDGKSPAKKPTRQEIELRKRLARGTTAYEKTHVDLDPLDVHNLVKELTSKYNQNNDVGVVRSFFRRIRVEAQEKHFNALLSLVSTVREHSSSLVDFKAQLMTQQKAIEQRMTAMVEREKFDVELQREEHSTALNQQQIERQRALLELDALKQSNEKAKWEAEKAKHEAEKAKHEAEAEKQRARIIELRGKLIQKIIDELQFADINMKQVFVLIEMVRDAATDSDVLGAEARWEQLKAEAKKTMAQAGQEETKADWERYKFEQDSKDPDY